MSPEEQQQEVLKSAVGDLLVPDLALDRIPALSHCHLLLMQTS